MKFEQCFEDQHVIFKALNTFKCVQSLYKSTYKRLAFKKGHTYHSFEEDDEFVWLINERGNRFGFTKHKNDKNYWIDEHFVNLNLESPQERAFRRKMLYGKK